jgi:hypothetical protein
MDFLAETTVFFIQIIEQRCSTNSTHLPHPLRGPQSFFKTLQMFRKTQRGGTGFDQGCGSVFILYGPGSFHHFRLNTDPDPDPIRIQGFDDQKKQKLEKIQLKKFIFFIKNYNFPIPRPP